MYSKHGQRMALQLDNYLFLDRPQTLPNDCPKYTLKEVLEHKFYARIPKTI